ncbi:MAG TPA: hypothetical protein VGA31_05245 [Thermoanaerobaculia bacterium]
MPKKDFSPDAIPPFESAPSVIAIVGDLPFFVEEAAARARERLAEGGVEALRFDEDAPSGSVAEALLNRSLFSPRRLVEVDISRVLGTDSPGELAEQAIHAWERGTPAGKREAFRRMGRLLVSLDVPADGGAEEVAPAIARKLKRKDLEETLVEILLELPEEKGGSGASLQSTLRFLIERENDGLVALLTASAPPKSSDLLSEIARKGLLLDATIGQERDEIGAALRRLALARAKENDVRIEPEAIHRLLVRTDSEPGVFAAELDKLLDWAGAGGQILPADVGEQVLDEASEDVYAFFEAVGRRDAAEALARLERLFSGRRIRAGERPIDRDDRWPQRFLGMLTDEIRRMLLVKSRLSEPGAPPFDPKTQYGAYKARVAPFLDEPVPPFGKSPFGGRAAGYGFYKAAARALRFTPQELARALSGAAELDVKLKNSAPELETITAYVGGLIAGS